MVRGGNVVINGGGNRGVVVPPILDPSQQPGNVYYVHPSDGPSSVAITPVLNNFNYHSWVLTMRGALGG